MRVLLIGNYSLDNQQSMQRFSGMMQAGLQDAGHQVRLVRPLARVGRIFHRNTSLAKWFGYVDKFAVFPRELLSLTSWADIIHICDHSNAHYVKYCSSRPLIVTCHDLLAISSAKGEVDQHKTKWTGKRLQQMILDGLRTAQHVTCVSDQTKAELLRFTKRSACSVSRIYNGLNYPYSPMPYAEARSRLALLGIEPKSFILHIGGNQWYKNRLGVLKVYAIARRLLNRNVNLVMAGKPLPNELQQFIKKENLGANVIALSNVSEEDLRALYSAALLLLFPSFNEGFGWPIVEAHACGCLVVTSNRAPMTEVGGKAAIYISPDDNRAAAEVVANALETPTDHHKAGIENAERFTSAHMVQAYVKVYQKTIREYPGSDLRG